MGFQRRAAAVARAGLDVPHADKHALVSGLAKQPHLRADAVEVALGSDRLHLQPVFVVRVVAIKDNIFIMLKQNGLTVQNQQMVLMEFIQFNVQI